jgi:hypothetical protein
MGWRTWAGGRIGNAASDLGGSPISPTKGLPRRTILPVEPVVTILTPPHARRPVASPKIRHNRCKSNGINGLSCLSINVNRVDTSCTYGLGYADLLDSMDHVNLADCDDDAGVVTYYARPW